MDPLHCDHFHERKFRWSFVKTTNPQVKMLRVSYFDPAVEQDVNDQLET